MSDNKRQKPPVVYDFENIPEVDINNVSHSLSDNHSSKNSNRHPFFAEGVPDEVKANLLGRKVRGLIK
ncbi:MAG: hypothetical protein HQL71_15230 [Magnetococcales bacterium]|nr:hypothetical protein [Magnetococcales bacterium]